MLLPWKTLRSACAVILYRCAAHCWIFGPAVAGPLVGIAVAALFFVARGLGQVLLADALNHRIPSQFRATANSLVSFGFRACFALGLCPNRLRLNVHMGIA